MTTKAKNIITWILAVILALAFFGAGISKLLGVESQIKNFQSWGYPLWLRFPIGLSRNSFRHWAINSGIPQNNHLWNFYLDTCSCHHAPAGGTG
jgi:uncharacterized membrane protein YphA (DoxX/SURF4 family)